MAEYSLPALKEIAQLPKIQLQKIHNQYFSPLGMGASTSCHTVYITEIWLEDQYSDLHKNEQGVFSNCLRDPGT